MNMRKITKAVLSTILAATCAVASLGLPAIPVNAASIGDVLIDSTNFKDSEFMEYVKKFDTNKNGVLSQAELNAVTEINVSYNTKIRDLSGIANFPNLKKLNGSHSTVSRYVDLRQNTNIEYVNLEEAPIEVIYVKGCTKLTHLDLFRTLISRIDISDCQDLIYYDVSGTRMKTVNIISFSSILDTYKNNDAKPATYSKTDVIGHGDYKSGYYFSYNPGANVISTCPDGYVNIYSPECINTNSYDTFSRCDVDYDGLISPSENVNITEVKVYADDVKDLEIYKSFPYITSITFYGAVYDGSCFPNLEKIEVFRSSKLTSLDLSSNTKLKSFSLTGCENLNYLDFSSNPLLESINTWGGYIISMNISNNTNLKSLNLWQTNIKEIDITHNPNLLFLGTEDTYIKEVDISNNPYLLECYNNNSGYVVDKAFSTEEWNLKKDDMQISILVDLGTKFITDNPIPVIPDPVVPGGNSGTTTPSTTPVVPGGNPGTTTPTTPVAPAAKETGLAGFIERLYNVALGRQSEAQGKNWWINKVKFENYTGSDVANGFLVSDEFLGKQMTNDQFLEVLYKTFFDRNSDAQGKTYWLDLMNSGYSKQDVISGFCNSTEWANLCLTYGIPSGSSATPTIVIIPNEGTNAFVTRLYTNCLSRDPEIEGFQYWTYRLANMQERGSSAMVGFFTSTEFMNKGYDNATYVTLLYRTILGREPDQAGLNYWLGLMANGMSRNDVLNGFAASTEWADICSTYGILK